MDIVKNENKQIKLTGVNRIIFEYCHFPRIFEDELKDKTKYIHDILKTNKDLCEYLGVYMNGNGSWFFGCEINDISGKFYITEGLYDRKDRYDKMMGIGRPEKICNKCYQGY